MTHRDEIHVPTADLVARALESARDLVEQGHCQGQAHEVDGSTDCWCAMGALAVVCSTVVLYSWTDDDGTERRAIVPGKQIFEAAVAALKIALSPRWDSVADFNDLNSTDAVVLLFGRAIMLVHKAVA